MQSTHAARAFLASLGLVSLSALPAAAQSQQWARQFGTTGYDDTYGAAPDGAGGVYVCGPTTETLGGASAGNRDVWIARYDSSGNRTWIRQLGSIGLDDAYGASSDGSGGVYVCGQTDGSLDGTNAGASDAWLARYDGAGNVLWVRQLGSSGADGSSGVAPDGAGGVYLAGSTSGTLGGASAGGTDAFVTRYDGTGNVLWIRQLGSSGDEGAIAAAPDGAGGVFVSGSTNGNLGGTNLGGQDPWIARYDAAGGLLWVRHFGTNSTDVARGAALDGSGGVYVTGFTFGVFGGSTSGPADAWLARYDGAGNQLWVRQYGTSTDDLAYGTAPDGAGGVFLGGFTYGSFGGANAGAIDAWLGRFDGAGNPQWIRQFGSDHVDIAYAVAQDGLGGLYVGGNTNGSLAGASAGARDAWLARYTPHLALLCEPWGGGVVACPCSNPAAGAGRGCDNSSGTGGASLSSVGDPSLSADTLSFSAQGEKPTATSVLLQGSSVLAQGSVFGQGVRCVGGTLKRIQLQAASGGVVSMPDFGSGDASTSARSAALGDSIAPGQSRWYTIYYRDPVVLGTCPAASTFNCGPTLRVDWQP